MVGIKNIIFDLGGVIIDLEREQSVKRFIEIGVSDAETLLDPYEQKGIFLELENGSLTFPQFCDKLRAHTGKNISEEAISHAWKGFIMDVPAYKLEYLLELRKKYKLYLLSNTNPVIMDWARTPQFTPAGRPITDYFDKIYASYEIGITKPDPAIFEYMIRDAGLDPSESLFVDDGKRNVEVGEEFGFLTYQPFNKEDWRKPVQAILDQSKSTK
ncbi:HAD family phosphatase [Parabacteroides sp. Marseille-P3160]|uniref:HAD family hydrolase n=1 Tax=Parabacteroides sp. Marseille-P3160 TaxID=1917887 RepID=UPI0009BA5F34|nr:HAD family phosphatase [Parabacteroides sp. Marseille-P3160]